MSFEVECCVIFQKIKYTKVSVLVYYMVSLSICLITTSSSWQRQTTSLTSFLNLYMGLILYSFREWGQDFFETTAATE